MMKHVVRLWMAALAVVISATAAHAVEPLRVSAIPDESPTELQRKFAPLGKYLEQQIGREVLFVPVNDYAAVVEALAADKVDLAWLGGFTFVQARLKTGNAVPLVQRAEDAKFTSKFIAHVGSGIDKLADLKGKNFAFGSPSSTSGHLMPRHFLAENGIDASTDFANIAFSGAHDATAAWVASGKVQAGALNASVWDKLVEQNKVDTSKVKVIWTTPTYYDYNWTARGSLDPALREKIKQAFLALDPNNPADAEILNLQRASRFIETKAENYQGIESAARKAGLLK